MFTGIVEHVGTVVTVSPRGKVVQFAIDCGPIVEGVDVVSESRVVFIGVASPNQVNQSEVEERSDDLMKFKLLFEEELLAWRAPMTSSIMRRNTAVGDHRCRVPCPSHTTHERPVERRGPADPLARPDLSDQVVAGA